MAKVVLASSVLTSAVALGLAIADSLATKHLGSEAGELITLFGQSAEQALATFVKPNSADAAGLPVEITHNGVQDTTAEGLAALGVEGAETAASGMVHGAA